MPTSATTDFNGHADPEAAPKKGKKVFLRSEVISWPAAEVARRSRELQMATIVDDMGFAQQHLLDRQGRPREPHADGR